VPSHQYIESDNATAHRADATTKTAMPPANARRAPTRSENAPAVSSNAVTVVRILLRDQRLPDDGHADPGDHATAALPGRPAALRPLRGRNFSCCQRQDPLLFTGAITQREFSAISGRR